MPTANPRVNVVLEKPLYAVVRELAHRSGVSLSTKVRDLVREAIELEEDEVLVHFAEQREKTFDRAAALTHEQVWGQARQEKR